MDIEESGEVYSLEADADLYRDMLRLEEMESLLEELDEASGGDAGNLPSYYQGRLSTLGLKDAYDLRRSVEALHNRLDSLE